MNQQLKQLGQQLLHIWQQLGLNQRISVVLAGSAVVLGLGALTFFSSRVAYQPLFTGLTSADAAKVVSALEADKIPYRTGGGGTQIMVPAERVDSLTMKLAPLVSGGTLFDDGDLIVKGNPMMTDAQQKAWLNNVRDRRLSRAIMTMEDIESAMVQVAEVPNSLIRRQDEKTTASVTLKVRGNRALARQSVQAIQALVANSVAGLRAGNVAISDTQGRLLSEEFDEGSPFGRASSQFAIRQQVEAYYAGQVRSMLDRVLGPGESTAVLSVELDMDTISRTERTIDAASKVPKSLTSKEETTTSTTGGGGAAAGIAANSAGQTNATATAAPQNLSNSTVKTTETVNEFGEIKRLVEQQAGSIKRLSVAVVINARFEGLGTARKLVPRTTQELDQLKQIVRSALGIQNDEGGTRKDEITLAEMPFNAAPLVEMNLQLEKQQRWQFWLALAGRLAYPALAVVILFLFVRAFRRTAVESILMGVPVGEVEENGVWNGTGASGKSRVVTVEVLNQLVKENPRNVTHALRAWMSGAPTKNN